MHEQFSAPCSCCAEANRYASLSHTELPNQQVIFITCHLKMPPSILPGSADSRNKFEDLSGVDIAAYANPYDALIEACHNDPVTTPFSSV
jgi:hypothetical protein